MLHWVTVAPPKRKVYSTPRALASLLPIFLTCRTRVMRRCCTNRAWRNLQLFTVSKSTKAPKWERFSSTTSRRSETDEDLLDLLQEVRKDVRDEVRWSRSEENNERRTKAAANRKIHRPLPLSPLMDPLNIAARQRHRTAKTPQGEDLTPFQRKLQSNPYGMLESL